MKFLLFVSQAYSFDIMRPLQTEIRARGYQCAWFITEEVINDKDVQKSQAGELVLETIQAVMDYKPDAVYSPSNIVYDFFPGVKVQIFHGITAKRDDGGKCHLKVRGFFDLYCTPNSFATIPLLKEQEERKFFKVVETGWPKFDAITTKDQSKKQTQKVILYAPTFSRKLTSTITLYDEIKRLTQTKDWKWHCTLHPKVEKETVQKYRNIASENFIFHEAGNTIPLIKEADVMLCDSSSIIAEFLALEKPVVTFNNVTPGPHLINFTKAKDLEKNIAKSFEANTGYYNSIKAYNNNIHPYNDGLCSKRVIDATLDFLENDYGKMPKKKPLNLLRKYKVRKSAHYYPIFH